MFDLSIFCDGACSGNPGPGGYGVYVQVGPLQTEFGGSAFETTNNQMELTAAIEALVFAKRETVNGKGKILVQTDSKYVIQGITEWRKAWVKRGWRNAKGEPVANRALWERLIELNDSLNVTWRWVKGHAGHEGNERADKVACMYRDRACAELAEQTTTPKAA